MPSRSRKWGLLALGALVASFLLYRSRGMFHLSQFSATKLWEAIRGANYLYLLLAVVTIYVCYAIRALRWQKFQAHVGQARFWNIYSMNLAGFSALFLLGRAAEPLRPLLISRKDKIPLADTFGIYALERILDASCTAVLAAIGLLVFESSGHASREGAGSAFENAARTAGTAFSIGAVVAISGLVYLRLHGSAVLERRMENWLAAHGWRASVARILLGFSRGVQTIRSSSDVAAAVFLSLLHWFMVVLCYFLVIRSFGGRLGTLTFTDAMLVLVFTMVGSAVQVARGRRRRSGSFDRCLYPFVWSRTGSGGGRGNGALDNYVRCLHACRCSASSEGRRLTRRSPSHARTGSRRDRCGNVSYPGNAAKSGQPVDRRGDIPE